MSQDEPLFIDVNHACKLLGIGRNLMYELIYKGTIPSVKLGRLRRIPYHWLKEYAQQVARQNGANG